MIVKKKFDPDKRVVERLAQSQKSSVILRSALGKQAGSFTGWRARTRMRRSQYFSRTENSGLGETGREQHTICI
jgi:hypothetical protein